MKLIVRTCKICGDEFTQETKQGRPRSLCSAPCETRARYESNQRYKGTESHKKAVQRAIQKKKEKWNPWLWENTILEWNE